MAKVDSQTPARSSGMRPWTAWRSIASSTTSAGLRGLSGEPAKSSTPIARQSAMKISRTAYSRYASE
eukprot:7384944-Prymnesium_polylepis.2